MSKRNKARGIVLIGAQWGDEGKGKVVDLLASRCDAVVRFQGGHNAGHTVIYGSETLVLQWATYYDASDEAGISRLYGGIHPWVDDLPGRIIGSQIGIAAFEQALVYFGDRS